MPNLWREGPTRAADSAPAGRALRGQVCPNPANPRRLDRLGGRLCINDPRPAPSSRSSRIRGGKAHGGSRLSHPCGISYWVGGTGRGTPLPPAIRCRLPWMRGRHRVSEGHRRACSGARRDQCHVRRGRMMPSAGVPGAERRSGRWRRWAGHHSRGMQAEGGLWPWSLAYRTWSAASVRAGRRAPLGWRGGAAGESAAAGLRRAPRNPGE